jgi:tetratricopeptide (TPR) repeat protein
MRSVLCLLAGVSLLAAEVEGPHIKAALDAYEAGEAARRNKQLQRASECFREAVEIEPTFLEAYESWIALYLDSGLRLEAAATMTRFLEIRPNAVRYRVLLGQVLLEQKETKRALAQYSLALKTDPYNPDGLLGFAAAAVRMGMRDRAMQALEIGRKRYPFDDRFKASMEPGNSDKD